MLAAQTPAPSTATRREEVFLFELAAPANQPLRIMFATSVDGMTSVNSQPLGLPAISSCTEDSPVVLFGVKQNNDLHQSSVENDYKI